MVVALDDCSVLHLVKVEIPSGLAAVIGKSSYKHYNCQKLEQLKQRVESSGSKLHRFIPDNYERNILFVMEELIGKANTAGAFILQKSIKDSLKKFFSSTGKDFIFIERCKSCDDVKQYFHTIKKKLNKSNNPIYSDIPEDDDLSIIKGYLLFTTPTKILVSEDEHFWGYSTEIETKYNIKIFHEKDCGTIPF